MKERNARYGLRAVRVGEAQHPGPPRLVVTRRLSPRPSVATLVDEAEPTQWESGADFSPMSRASASLPPDVPTVRMDDGDSLSTSLVGALEQDLMSSTEEEPGLWPEQENPESDGESVVSGVVPEVEPLDTINVPEVYQLSPGLREAFRRLDRIDLETIFSKRAVVMKTVPLFLKVQCASPWQRQRAMNTFAGLVGGSCSCSCPGCC